MTHFTLTIVGLVVPVWVISLTSSKAVQGVTGINVTPGGIHDVRCPKNPMYLYM
ncbi:hypothetical protein PTI98_001660 [Pleurotus ostreatus]|nr:hypothetical protein PTI98_001660 [Pleurotus ostreatus]